MGWQSIAGSLTLVMVGRTGEECGMDVWEEEKAWLPTIICWKWLRSKAAAGEGLDDWMTGISTWTKVSDAPGVADVAGSCAEAGDAISPVEGFEALGVAGEVVKDVERGGGVVIHPSRLFEVGVVADGEVGAARGSKMDIWAGSVSWRKEPKCRS